MADKHAVNYDIRELKLGASFTNNKATQYHTIKYDFKPASVDVNKMATVDVGTNNQVTVTVPHLDGAGVPQTVFKGNQRPYTKECVLIIDKITGDITLEKLSSNIQLKKTRQECVSKPRPVTPALTDTTMRSSSRTRVATNRRTATPAGNSGLSASAASRAPGLVRSPPRHRTEAPQAAPWTGGNSTLASLPMIGLLDEPAAPPPAPHPAPPPAPHSAPPPAPHAAPHAAAHLAPHAAPHAPPPAALQIPVAPAHPVRRPPEAASGSSSSSSSDSGSDSDSNSDDDAPKAANLPPDVLNDDLCLSSSDSD